VYDAGNSGRVGSAARSEQRAREQRERRAGTDPSQHYTRTSSLTERPKQSMFVIARP